MSHLGFVVLGIFAFTEQAVTGGVLQMVNHGLATGALFLLVGMVYERTHTRDLAKMGGLASVMPWLTGAFLFAVFAGARHFESDAHNGQLAFAARIHFHHIKGVAGFGGADLGGIDGVVAELFCGELMFGIADLAMRVDAFRIELDMELHI